jgi:hypothetical protein
MWGKGVQGTHLEEALRPRLLFISAMGPDESSFSTKEAQSGQEDERRGVVWGYSTESSSVGKFEGRGKSDLIDPVN